MPLGAQRREAIGGLLVPVGDRDHLGALRPKGPDDGLSQLAGAADARDDNRTMVQGFLRMVRDDG
ncbi:hypothetical protein D3C86_1786410 [compost metagenome]